jgi:hypothetical protein
VELINFPSQKEEEERMKVHSPEVADRAWFQVRKKEEERMKVRSPQGASPESMMKRRRRIGRGTKGGGGGRMHYET